MPVVLGRDRANDAPFPVVGREVCDEVLGGVERRLAGSVAVEQGDGVKRVEGEVIDAARQNGAYAASATANRVTGGRRRAAISRSRG